MTIVGERESGTGRRLSGRTAILEKSFERSHWTTACLNEMTNDHRPSEPWASLLPADDSSVPILWPKVDETSATVVVLVRHAATEENREGVVIGHLNPPLDAASLRQVSELAKTLRNFWIDRIYCSPLVRAASTAQVIAEEVRQEVSQDPRLREADYGNLDGVAKTSDVYIRAMKQRNAENKKLRRDHGYFCKTDYGISYTGSASHSS